MSCASSPVIRTRTVTVKVPSYVSIPAALTASVPYPVPPAHMTNGDLLQLCIQRGNSIKQANDQLSRIRQLQVKK